VAILILEIFCLLAATVEGTFKSLDAGFRYIPAWLTVSDYKEMYKRMLEIWVRHRYIVIYSRIPVRASGNHFSRGLLVASGCRRLNGLADLNRSQRVAVVAQCLGLRADVSWASGARQSPRTGACTLPVVPYQGPGPLLLDTVELAFYPKPQLNHLPYRNFHPLLQNHRCSKRLDVVLVWSLASTEWGTID